MTRTDAARPPGSARKAPIRGGRYTAAVIPSFVLAGLIDYARARQIDPRPWFTGSGLSAEQCFEAETRVSFRQMASLLQRALRAMPASGVGLAIGSRDSLASFGVLGFAMLSSRTVGEAMALGTEYHQLSGSLMDFSVELPDGGAVLVVHERFAEPALLGFLCEETFASVLAICRSLTGAGFHPQRLELRYPPPPWAEDYLRLFRCPVHFNASRNALTIDRAWLALPLPTHNPANLAAALQLCRAQTEAERPKGDLVTALELWLRGRCEQSPTAAQGAQALHLTERTLRRRLAAAGTSFQTIHDRVRVERAEALLGDPQLRIADIAGQLGFSDAREFRRAYKRWTGHAPRH